MILFRGVSELVPATDESRNKVGGPVVLPVEDAI